MMRYVWRHSLPRFGALATGVALLALMATSPAIAQYGRWGDYGQESSNQSEQGWQGQQSMTIQGTIDWVEQIQVFGGPRMEHATFARLHLRDGNTVMVEFGPRTDLSSLDLRPGNRVMINGYREEYNNEPVLVAERLRVNGQRIQFTPAEAWGGQQRGYDEQGGYRSDGGFNAQDDQGQGYQRSQESQTMLRGTVDHVRQLQRFGGRPMQNDTVVELQFRDGRTAIVDFGPNTDLSNLDINPGSRIDVSGYRERINRQPVLMAERLRVDGERKRFTPAEEWGQYGNQGNDGYRSSSESRSESRQSPQGEVMLRGTVDHVRQLHRFGGPQMQDETVVRLDLRNGRTAIVDFGPNTDLSNLDINPGSRIDVNGYREQVNGRPVLMAERLRVNGESKHFTPAEEWGPYGSQGGYGYRGDSGRRQGDPPAQSSSSQRWQSSASQQSGQTSFSGTIENMKRVDLSGKYSNDTTAEIDLQDGKSMIVDFGPNFDLSKLNAKSGDRIDVMGKEMSASGKQLLVAKKVRLTQDFDIHQGSQSSD